MQNRVTNWNDATTPGWYSSNNIYATNCPDTSDANGWLQVLTLRMDNNPTFTQQIGFWGNRMFFRGQNGGTWDTWKKLDLFLDTTTAQTGNISVGTTAVYWSITATRSGYTPLMYSHLNYGNSTTVALSTEGRNLSNGSFKINGYARSITSTTYTINISTLILWHKN